MGFGSYDESEQQKHEVNDDDDESEGVNVHVNEHEGTVSFESGSSVTDLVSKLSDMKKTED
ncbi:DUF5786 family protein [Halegenticoccus soli]|uniref:DUF5786 family protein n=1 Tax=Halegenticoccus soli TaxID=1985678 RepID=UPI000C6DF439|nr:DUF5786 family protein [Halegenticoccus soli]